MGESNNLVPPFCLQGRPSRPETRRPNLKWRRSRRLVPQVLKDCENNGLVPEGKYQDKTVESRGYVGFVQRDDDGVILIGMNNSGEQVSLAG